MFIDLLRGFLDQGIWYKRNEILAYLHENGWQVNKRNMELEFEKIQDDYIHCRSEYTIASDNQLGYILTKNPKFILKKADDYHTRAMNCLKKEAGLRNRVGNRNQIMLDIGGTKVDLYELIKAMEEDDEREEG